jgi:hypothetical protein
MKNTKFLSLLLLLAAVWGCKKETGVAPTQSQAISSENSDAAPDNQVALMPDGLYVIKAMAHPELGLVLDVPDASTADGIFIQQFKYNGGPNQLWQVTFLGNGYYSIRNFNSGKSLDIPDGSMLPGVKVQQFTYHGGTNQQWKIKASNGVKRIYNRRSGLALDVPDGSGASGVLIQQFTPNGGSNQTWKFIRF